MHCLSVHVVPSPVLDAVFLSSPPVLFFYPNLIVSPIASPQLDSAFESFPGTWASGFAVLRCTNQVGALWQPYSCLSLRQTRENVLCPGLVLARCSCCGLPWVAKPKTGPLLRLQTLSEHSKLLPVSWKCTWGSQEY